MKKIIYYHRTFEEYKKQKLEIDRLKVRLIGLEEVVKENNRLEKLLEFKRRLVYSASAASVVGRDLSRWNSSFIIDRGEKDGVVMGQPVVNEVGVVGKIAEIGNDKSKVVMLTDPQFSVAAMVQRTRESGVISGTLQGKCRLKFVNADADIRVGDQVITSKLSTTFPESLIIGEVVEIREGRSNVPKECIVKPAVSFSQLEEILILSK